MAHEKFSASLQKAMQIFKKILVKQSLIVKVVIACMLLWGAAMACFEIKPFWHDEWRLIYNLKFKTHTTLWGDLFYTQQFPRVYLQLLKYFTEAFHYNYFSLRVPAFLVAVASVFLCWYLMNRIFYKDSPVKFLFVLILLSSNTFIEYFVQTKHYEMEIFMSLVALWQCLEIIYWDKKCSLRFLSISVSLLVAPFFSYTYPIAIAPFFIIVLFQFFTIKNPNRYLLFFPVLASLCGIALFYYIDVAQLMADEEMKLFWKFRMMSEGGGWLKTFEKLWGFFAKVGAGFVFEIVFGVLGIYAFYWNVRRSICKRSAAFSASHLIICYAIGVIIVSIFLFLFGKLPLGEPKFNCFAVPALALLIVKTLEAYLQKEATRKYAVFIAVVIYLAVIGNIFSSMINTFTLPEYAKRMTIYHATEKAIATAQKNKLPILVTVNVAFPDDLNSYMPGMEIMSAASVLKTFPAYDVQQAIPVYSIEKMATAHLTADSLHLPSYIAGDGEHYRLISKE